MTHTTVIPATLAVPPSSLSLTRTISPPLENKLNVQDYTKMPKNSSVTRIKTESTPEPLYDTTSRPADATVITGLGIQIQQHSHQVATYGYKSGSDNSPPQLAHPPDDHMDVFYDFYNSRPGVHSQSNEDPNLADPCSSWLRPLSSNSSSSQGISEVANSSQTESGFGNIWGLDAFSGITPGVFVGQIPTSNELALQYLCNSSQATNTHHAFGQVGCTPGDMVSNSGKPLVSHIPMRPGGSVLVSNSGFYPRGYHNPEPALCINPADLIGEMCDVSTFQDNSSSSSVSSSLNSVPSSRHAYSVLDYPPLSQQELRLVKNEPPTTPPETVGLQLDEGANNNSGQYFDMLNLTRPRKRSFEASDYAPSPRPGSSPSPESSPFPSPPKRRPRGRPVKGTRKLAKKASKTTIASITSNTSTAGSEEVKNEEPRTVVLGTPVLDAHRGVHIEDLESKAERYRLRNPGMEYDKRWLLSFAGKLTPRGELLDEYRCYIVGCTQTNKRRDHILIHLGAHLDQRPFQCQYCSSRFLRKNECKRHELGHIGTRPFSCDLCPFEEVTFVRQDLLKRHLKRTHNIEATSKSNKENQPDSRKPAKKTRHTR
ncbi:hypothetical protein AX16_000085 [Volvariella volvacea WC 439]|nr:hypothetical protein AX16_000085 [Volvariella volvacea WC 439]